MKNLLTAITTIAASFTAKMAEQEAITKKGFRHITDKVNMVNDNVGVVVDRMDNLEAKVDDILAAVKTGKVAPVQEPQIRNNNQHRTTRQYNAMAEALVPIKKSATGEAVFGICEDCGLELTSNLVVGYCKANGIPVYCPKCQKKHAVDSASRGIGKAAPKANAPKANTAKPNMGHSTPKVESNAFLQVRVCGCCGEHIKYTSVEMFNQSQKKAKELGLPRYIHGKCAAKMIAEMKAKAEGQMAPAKAPAKAPVVNAPVVEAPVQVALADVAPKRTAAESKAAAKERLLADKGYVWFNEGSDFAYTTDDAKEGAIALGFTFRRNIAKAKKAELLTWLKANKECAVYITDEGVTISGSYAELALKPVMQPLSDEKMAELKEKVKRMKDVSDDLPVAEDVPSTESMVAEQADEWASYTAQAEAEVAAIEVNADVTTDVAVGSTVGADTTAWVPMTKENTVADKEVAEQFSLLKGDGTRLF